jgi:ABC-type multidrug transport system, ATPase and permease components
MSDNNQNSQTTQVKQQRPASPFGPMGPRGGRGGGGGGGPVGRLMPGEKAKDFKGTVKQLLSYLSKYKLSLVAVAVFASLSTIFGIFGPKTLGRATTELFRGTMAMITGTGGVDFEEIARILTFLMAIYIASAVLRYLQNFIMSGINAKIAHKMRKDLSEKINRLPLKYFDSISQGEVLSHITNDVDSVSSSLEQSVTEIVSSITNIVGVLVMMLSISIQLTFVAILTIPLSLIVVRFVVSASQKYFRAQQEYLGNVNGHIEEMYSGHIVVKSFNGEESAINTFEEYNDKLFNANRKSQFLSGIMMPFMRFIGNIGYVAVCIMGSNLAINGAISVGDIQAFIMYVRNFTQPLTQVANISNVLQQTAAAAERIFTFLNEEEETPDPVDAEHISDIKGSVEFRNVKFGYTDEKTIINDFSATVQPGQKIAIVGPTGAGKTTLVKLLMRFYDVNSGAIFVDGHNTQNLTRNDLRSCFGMVLQDTWLYHASVADNIRYSKLDATDEEVRQAAWAAQADRFIKTLPEGYDMLINEDASNISQGQKQLLTIARAILADPQILILDEATSSVDTRTEIYIQQAMDTLMAGRTSFVIAHRLSTIRNADSIIVMNNGDIVETGNHEALLAKKGFYYELYQSQFETKDAAV